VQIMSGQLDEIPRDPQPLHGETQVVPRREHDAKTRRRMSAESFEHAERRRVGGQLVCVVHHQEEVTTDLGGDLRGEHLGHRVGLGLPVRPGVRFEGERRGAGDAARQARHERTQRGERPRERTRAGSGRQPRRGTRRCCE